MAEHNANLVFSMSLGIDDYARFPKNFSKVESLFLILGLKHYCSSK